jgi:hypothetical protein
MAPKTNQKDAARAETGDEDETVEDISQVFANADLDSMRED